MDRRSFLSLIGAGAIRERFIGRGWSYTREKYKSTKRLSSTTGNGARVRKAIKFHRFESDASLVERFRIIKEAGFEGVEFRSPNDYSTNNVLEAQEKTGLEVVGVIAGWQHFGSDEEDAVAKSHTNLRTALQDASDYGASTCLLIPETVNADMPYDQAYNQSIYEIKKSLSIAEDLGVQIGIENVFNNFLLSPLEFARYVDEFQSEWVGAYFDIGNAHWLGWPEQWIRVLGDRIIRLDVKGYSRDIMNQRGPSAGFEADIIGGTIDWSAVRAALVDIGYDGWGTCEESKGGEDRIRAVAAQMDRVLPTT